jgi:hypothetical protein
MTDLARMRTDLRAFSEAIDWPLAPWQADALKLAKRTTTIVANRQAGKSRSLGVLALHRAFCHPDSRALIVSSGEDGAKRLLAEIATVAASSPLLSGSVTDETTGLLVLSNGSEVRSVPASERAIRGWTVDTLLLDEAALIEDELLLNACIPTTAARPDARIVLASSPASPEGAFHSFAEQGDQDSPHTQTFHWRLHDCDWIDPSAVEAAQESLAPAAFTREYLGQFTDVGIDERVVERSWIAQAQQRTLQERGEPVYAVDVARHGGDETVIVRIAGGRLRVVWAARGLQSIMPIAGQIEALSRAEDRAVVPEAGPLFVIDVDGIGWGVFDRCRQMGNLRVEAFQGGTSAMDPRRHLNKRSEAWWLARDALRLNEVDLDLNDRLLAAQLGQVTYSLANSGAVQIQPKRAMRQSPDRGDASVMAIWAAARQHRGEVLSELAQRIKAEAERAPVDPLLAGSVPAAEMSWQGRKRGNWRERLDPDLPTWPGI